MSRDLYFIPIVAAALDAPDPAAALRSAFAEISRLGQVPEYRQGLSQFRQFMRVAADREVSVDILLERNGRPVPVPAMSRVRGRTSAAHLLPGYYRLRLGTGRLLWEGELTDRDLLWNAAFPGKALDLAADTGGAAREPTRRIDLLDGDMVLRVYPGLESGFLDIEIGGDG